ncbi:MAG TPA: carbohydrate binding domain-containing protein, partial [Niastella sp.]
MYTYEKHRPWRLAVLKSLPLIIFFSLFSKAYAQQVIPLTNPSLEGPPGINTVPAPWYIMDGTPDTEINDNNALPLPASNGNNYVRIVCSMSGAEEFACELVQQLDSGKTYEVSFDLAMENSARFPVTYASFQIYGNKSLKEKGEVLWQSGVFSHKTWKRYTATFKPLKNYKSLTFSPYLQTLGDFNTVVVSYVDNFSAITETFILDVDVKNTCPGQNNGAATVNIPDPAGAYSYYWAPTGATTKSVN